MSKKKRNGFRESPGRWFIDRKGTLWLNVKAMRRKPLTEEEWAAINAAFAAWKAASDGNIAALN